MILLSSTLLELFSSVCSLKFFQLLISFFKFNVQFPTNAGAEEIPFQSTVKVCH